eukprot:2600011-Rhodomonas_salina.2
MTTVVGLAVQEDEEHAIGDRVSAGEETGTGRRPLGTRAPLSPSPFLSLASTRTLALSRPHKLVLALFSFLAALTKRVTQEEEGGEEADGVGREQEVWQQPDRR